MGLLDSPLYTTTSGTPSYHGADSRQWLRADIPGGEVPAPYGYRRNGEAKGMGWLGAIGRKDNPGDVSTELTMTFNYGGNDVDVPLLVPTLTREEVDHLVSGLEPTHDIKMKAYKFGAERLGSGLSPYAD